MEGVSGWRVWLGKACSRGGSTWADGNIQAWMAAAIRRSLIDPVFFVSRDLRISTEILDPPETSGGD